MCVVPSELTEFSSPRQWEPSPWKRCPVNMGFDHPYTYCSWYCEELNGKPPFWRAPWDVWMLRDAESTYGHESIKKKHPKIARLLDSAAKVFPKRYSTDLTFLLLVKTRHHLANSPICDGFYNVIPKWHNNIHIHIFNCNYQTSYIHTYMYVTYHHIYMYIWSNWIPWLNWSIQINILIQLQFYHDWWLLGYIACIINIAYIYTHTTRY